MARLFAFLESVRAVWQGRACLTESGAEYMGVEFRFPPTDETVSDADPQDAHSVDRLKARIIATLTEDVA